jgi:hypothetical protein
LSKHLPSKKEDLLNPTGIQSTMKTLEHLRKTGSNTSKADNEEKENKLLLIKPVYQNIHQVDLWENADRQPNNNDDVKKYTDMKQLTSTLEEALKQRPPVAEFIQNITKATKEDMEKSIQRERDELYNYKAPNDNTESKTVEKAADEIYREILNVVQANSPTSLPVSRGRMVGFGKQFEYRIRHPTNVRNIKDSETPGHYQR